MKKIAQQVQCLNGSRRAKREVPTTQIVTRSPQSTVIETTNGTKVVNVTQEDFHSRGKDLMKGLPLEFILIVHQSKVHPDRLVYGENNRILVAGYGKIHLYYDFLKILRRITSTDYIKNEVCLDYSLSIGIIITWILVQFVFIITCVVLIRRYKKHYEDATMRQSMEELHKNFGFGFSNLDNRRVHFADSRDFH